MTVTIGRRELLAALVGAATLPFDGQGVSAWDARQTAKERRPSDNSMAAFPLLRFLYWIYERRLLNQLKQRPMALSWMEIAAMLASEA